MSKRHPQGEFAPYREWISNIKHYKRNTGRHSVDEYTELEGLVDDE